MNSSVNWPPRFSLDQERILNLLTGDRFYSNASAALREAVLNAVDAIHRRRLTQPDTKPRLRIAFNHRDLTLDVSDNGEGMDQDAIANLFSKIGASAAHLDRNRGSVGEFGIGVISYFMAADTFVLETRSANSDPIALSFNRSMLAGGQAEIVPARERDQGTSLTLFLRDEATLKLLLDNFSHWCRDVQGLVAITLPENKELRQGGVQQLETTLAVSTPSWIERAHVGPVIDPKGWEGMSGSSSISILYRGVFVQEFIARGLWGIAGSIDVDPKHFKPKLNREGFIGQDFESQVQNFLSQVHPTVLAALAPRLSLALKSGSLDKWSERRWATLWLSVPRSAEYQHAAKAWDESFREIRAFEVARGDKWDPISLDELKKLKPPLYIAPHPEERPPEVATAAVRLLRLTGQSVVRGVRKEANWLREASTFFASTADLIASVFREEMPELLPIASNAEHFLNAVEPVARLFTGPPAVDLVRYGNETPPFLRLQDRLLINIENEKGERIVLDIIENNGGPASLIPLAAHHAHEQLAQVAAVVRESQQISLGLLKRRFLRSLFH